MAATYLGGGGAGERMASFYFPFEDAAQPEVPVTGDTHDGSPRRVADYISEQAAKDIDRNREIFERSQRQWSDDLDRIIANAFAKVMGARLARCLTWLTASDASAKEPPDLANASAYINNMSA